MATISRRGATWTNADGLVVGFGTHNPPTAGGSVKTVGGPKVTKTYFTYEDVNAARSIYANVPAGSRVLDVRLIVGTAWAGASNALIVGDGSDTDGYVTTSAAGVASLTAGASINPDGVYGFGATDTGAAELKTYSSADTIDVASADTDWTAGTATLVVTYFGPDA